MKNLKLPHVLGALLVLGSVSLSLAFYLYRKKRLNLHIIDDYDHILTTQENEDSEIATFEALEKEIAELDDIKHNNLEAINLSCNNLSRLSMNDKTNEDIFFNYQDAGAKRNMHNNSNFEDASSMHNGSSNTYPRRRGLTRNLTQLSDYPLNSEVKNQAILLPSTLPHVNLNNFDSKKAENYVHILVASLENSFLNENFCYTNALYENLSPLKGIHPPTPDSGISENGNEDFIENYRKVMQPRVDLLLKTLNTISNLSAFTENQNLFRELGCLNHLMRILATSTNCRILASCAQCIANLSLNEENQIILKECVPLILKLLLNDYIMSAQNPNCNSSSSNLSHSNSSLVTGYYTIAPGDKYKGSSPSKRPKNWINLNSRFAVVALDALVNLTVLDGCTDAFCGYFESSLSKARLPDSSRNNYDTLSKLLTKFITDQKNYEIKLSALKLMVNLSCYPENLPFICKAKVDKNVLFLFGTAIDTQILMRSITLFEHIIKYLVDISNPERRHAESERSYNEIPGDGDLLSPSSIVSNLPDEYNFSFDSDSIAGIILFNANYLKGKMSQLKCHRNPDISDLASKIFGYLNSSFP